jgi:hypothetical protein
MARIRAFGAFIAGKVAAAELDDIVGVDAGGSDYDRRDGFAPAIVGDTNHRSVGDGGMRHDHTFHLGSIDVLAAGGDHVLRRSST